MSAGTFRQRLYLNAILLFAFSALTLLSVSTPVMSSEARTVSVGIVSDNKPYSNIEGRSPSGFSIDILREVARHSELTFEFRAGTWAEVFGAFMRGEIDIIDGISYREERAEKILFTSPYHIRQIYLMHDPANPLGDISSLEALSGAHVGIVQDIYYRDVLTDAGINYTSYSSIPSLVRALAFGWVDGVLGPELPLKYYANLAGFRFLEVAGEAPLGELSREDFRLGVLKGNEALFEAVSKGLDAIPQSTITELFERWQEFGGASITEAPAIELSSAQRRYLRELGPIRVGFMRDYAPFSFQDANLLQGLSVDVMNRVADLTGLQIIPVTDQWSELYPMYLKGDIDIMANISESRERRESSRFTAPYHIIPNVAFTLDGSLEFSTVADLKGLRVATGAGIYYEQALKDQLGDDIYTFTSQRGMFQALKEGTVDVVLAALPNGNYWVRELRITGVTVAGEMTLDGKPGEDLRFGVRPALEPLALIIDEALAAISPTEKRTIENRWLGASIRRAPEPTEDVTFTATETAWLEKKGKQLTICVNPDWLPLEGLDDEGRHRGVAAETFRLFSERSGIEFVPRPVDSWPESVRAAKNRDCDLFSMAMETPDRLGYMNFTSPYAEIPGVLVGRIEAPFIDSLDDLSGQPVGIGEGYALAELLTIRNPNLNLVEVGNEKDGLRMVQQRELAAFLSSLATASYNIQRQGLADLKVIGRAPADWAAAVATRNDEPELLGIMQKLVDSLTEQERNTIEQHWSGISLQQKTDYTLIAQVGAVALLVLGLLFYWNRKLGRLNRELASANARLAHLSVTDDLTQIGNRSYFDTEFSKSFHWCQRHQQGFAVAMVDADHFKTINDTHGHAAGDQCLKALADILREHFRRDTDRLTRFGGEEFVIFTSFSDREELISRLESFREALARSSTPCDDAQLHFTVSIGLATGIPGKDSSAAEFLRMADKALYAAKQNGRNRLETRAVESGNTDS
ncbi:transporter substrate-binding domain-containing protein [Marinobacter sp. ATCH36]|uniref:transporter substrate-binding domain-containing diguanylate cyclase n=1 Tax=Marinobacter sp. ATCH36 TaxID=2945106 RepID=UPI00201FE4A2|nr:transporter substrate-binding domain-containing protein [Marinobacter sp. ATCH36]MCL7942994.1 transporter substrate-binding domain-containing protein [Marinobacter sp. ATCH36]